MRVTLAYPPAWNPDTARQKHIDEVIRRHLSGDLAAAFGPYQATWVHPPAPPALARFDGYDLPDVPIVSPPLAGTQPFAVLAGQDADRPAGRHRAKDGSARSRMA